MGGSARKMGLRIRELERLYGVREGSANTKGTIVGEKNSFTQEALAKNMDIELRTLQNYKLLSDMIPELSDLVDTGSATKLFVSDLYNINLIPMSFYNIN